MVRTTMCAVIAEGFGSLRKKRTKAAQVKNPSCLINLYSDLWSNLRAKKVRESPTLETSAPLVVLLLAAI
jgi:hypothetical protein